MLENRDDKTLMLDVRNDYEWEIGHFDGAELPELETFREFPQYARKLKRKARPKGDESDDVLHGRDPLRALFRIAEKRRI